MARAGIASATTVSSENSAAITAVRGHGGRKSVLRVMMGSS
jgi:hypothetical protein